MVQTLSRYTKYSSFTNKHVRPWKLYSGAQTVYFNSLIFSKFTNQCLRNKVFCSNGRSLPAFRKGQVRRVAPWLGPACRVEQGHTGASRGSASKQSARWQVFMSHQWHATRQQIPQGHGTKLRKGTALKPEHCRLRSSSSTVHISLHLSISFGSGLQPSVQGRLLLTNASHAVVSKAGVIFRCQLATLPAFCLQAEHDLVRAYFIFSVWDRG